MNIPKEWRDFLALVQQVDPFAILAGGALRDLDHGRPVKDLDIFVQPGFNHAAFEKLLPPGSYWPVMRRADYASLVDVQSIWGSYVMRDSAPEEFAETYPVQIIELNRLMPYWEVISRLDFGLCQIGFDGTAVFNTVAYKTDRDNKTFTLVRIDDEVGARARRREERLSKKYSDFRFIYPQTGDSK